MAARKVIIGPAGERVRRRVAELRDRRRLTLEQVAGRLAELGHPLQPTAVSRIEQGERRVDADDLVALALALEVTPNTLLLPATASEDEQFQLTDGLGVQEYAAWHWACGSTRLPMRFSSNGPEASKDEQEAARDEFFRLASPHTREDVRNIFVGDDSGIDGERAMAFFLYSMSVAAEAFRKDPGIGKHLAEIAKIDLAALMIEAKDGPRPAVPEPIYRYLQGKPDKNDESGA